MGNIGGPLRTLDEIDEWSVDESGYRDSEDTVDSNGRENGTGDASRFEAELGDVEAGVPLNLGESTTRDMMADTVNSMTGSVP